MSEQSKTAPLSGAPEGDEDEDDGATGGVWVVASLHGPGVPSRPLTPERAEIEALRNAVRIAETGHADALVRLHWATAELRAADAALHREHGESETKLREVAGQRDRALADLKATAAGLGAIAQELERVISGALALKIPVEAVEFAKRVRALAIPPSEPSS